MELQRTGHCDLMYMKMKGLCWEGDCDPNHWHWLLSREYNNESEASA